MKHVKLFVLLSSFTIMFVFTSCEMLNGIFGNNGPEETEIEVTNEDGSVTTGIKTVYDDYTITETKTVGTDYITETIEKEELKEDDTGKTFTVVTIESITTYDDDSSGDVKSIKLNETETQTNEKRVVDTHKDTVKKDGTTISEHLIEDTKNGTKKTTTETKSADGKLISKEDDDYKELLPEQQIEKEEGYKITSTEEINLVTYDDQGKESTKVVITYDNPNRSNPNNLPDSYNKAVKIEYKFVNGEPKETKRTEELSFGCNSKKEIVSNDDGTKTISISIKALDGVNLGSGSGTTDKDGVTTIENIYTNGIKEKTVENKTSVIKEILTDEYYEKTEKENGVLKNKECEYYYDVNAGIVFKTVTTYSSEVENNKSNRHIGNESLTPAKYDEVSINVPSVNGIYESMSSLDVYADGTNAEAYTVFTVKVWDGSKADFVETKYPFDDSVDMTNLHFPPAE